MERSFSAAWLSDVAEPLSNKFGGGLSLCRDGNAVRWGYAGQFAVVEMLPSGKMVATFVDRQTLDEVSHRPAAAAYASRSSYALNPASCSRLIADMVDFFSGVREPQFTFIDAFPR